MVFDTEHIVGAEFGPGDSSQVGPTVSVYPLTSTRMAVMRGGSVTVSDVVNTDRPTASPTPSPTLGPTARPTPEPFSVYFQRKGRSCGLDQTLITDHKSMALDDCKTVCTADTECRCFDLYDEWVSYSWATKPSDVYRITGCRTYKEFDSDITWTAGQTHSFIKESTDVLNVKMVLYAINSEGELVENDDLKALYNVEIDKIKVHTTSGQVGVIWNYVPSMHN
jgi:hypothetical protein